MKTKTVLGGAMVALALMGASAGGASAAVSFVIGEHGAHIGVSNGYYYDSHHHRHMYAYPSDYATYHHPMSWYRSHPHWRDMNHHDWYRH